MGKIKYIGSVMDFLEKTPVANMRDFRMIIKNPDYSRLLLHNLEKTGKIWRITRGFYSLYNDPSLAVFCFRPAYIGMQDALSVHDLWEQETNTIIITQKKARPGIRKIMDSNVVIHRLDKKYFFGYELTKQGDFFLPVSDKEKTLIDLIYFNEIPDKNVLKRIRRVLDNKKLDSYLKHYPAKFRNRVLKAVA